MEQLMYEKHVLPALSIYEQDVYMFVEIEKLILHGNNVITEKIMV
jgi:hypothetical protein